MSIIIDTRWIGAHGIGRFAAEIVARMPELEVLPQGPARLSWRDPIWLGRTLTRLRPDLYFSPGFNPPLRSPVPFIFTIHDLIHLDVAAERSAVKRLYYDCIVKPATRRAARVVTISEFSKGRIAEWAGIRPEKIAVIRLGVSEAFGPTGARHSQTKPYMLYVGNSKPHKNLRRLLEAYKVSGCRGAVDLILCAPEDLSVLGWIDGLDLSEAVTVTGTVSDDALAALYRGAIGLVFPTLYEGFGLPALEAMACGTAVLTSAVTAVPEVVGDAALMVDPADTDSMAGGIRQLVEDEELQQVLRERGVKRAAAFTWEKTVLQLRELFQEVLEDGAPPRGRNSLP